MDLQKAGRRDGSVAGTLPAPLARRASGGPFPAARRRPARGHGHGEATGAPTCSHLTQCAERPLPALYQAALGGQQRRAGEGPARPGLAF